MKKKNDFIAALKKTRPLACHKEYTFFRPLGLVLVRLNEILKIGTEGGGGQRLGNMSPMKSIFPWKRGWINQLIKRYQIFKGKCYENNTLIGDPNVYTHMHWLDPIFYIVYKVTRGKIHSLQITHIHTYIWFALLIIIGDFTGKKRKIK